MVWRKRWNEEELNRIFDDGGGEDNRPWMAAGLGRLRWKIHRRSVCFDRCLRGRNIRDFSALHQLPLVISLDFKAEMKSIWYEFVGYAIFALVTLGVVALAMSQLLPLGAVIVIGMLVIPGTLLATLLWVIPKLRAL